jgi:DNA polymerase III epsilon subunit-like protein
MRVMIFDTETDGLIINPEMQQQPRIVEIYLLMLEQISDGPAATFKELGSWHRLVNPERAIADDIIAIHHISNEMVASAETFDKIAAELGRLICSANRVVAHFAMFDRMMVDLEFARCGVAPLQWPELFCTVEQTEHWFQHRLPLGTNAKGKQGLYQLLFKEDFKDAHRAEADVKALVRCYQQCERMGWNWSDGETIDPKGQMELFATTQQ